MKTLFLSSSVNFVAHDIAKQVEEKIDFILAIAHHEYLHQGQMIISFREAGIDLPERYKEAWAL